MTSSPVATKLPRRWIAFLPLLVVPLVGVAVFFILRHELAHITYASLRSAATAIPLDSIAFAFGCTLISYLLLTMYDVLGLRHIDRTLPYSQTALASFTSYVASHNLGFAGLGGSAVRFRVYSSFGLGGAEIAELIGFCTITFWLGLLSAGGVAFLVSPVDLGGHFAWLGTTRGIGVALLAALAIYVVCVVFVRRPLRIRGYEFELPSARMVAVQIPLAILDWTASATVLYLLLPPIEGVHFVHVFGVFMAAQILGMISHVPGGLGVFESTILVLLPGEGPTESILASLVVYRFVYYVVPLVVGIALFAWFEFRIGARARLAALGHGARPMVRALVPRYMAGATFLTGALLLLSGATPAKGDRIAWLRDFLPLSIVEMSHFTASIVGAALLVLARGLQRRIGLAWTLTVSLLLIGIALSLLKGFDWEEALILAIMLSLLIPCRSVFERTSSLLVGDRSPAWIMAWIMTVVGAAMVGLFAYKHVPFSNQLWWEFAFHGDAPRFLRAAVGSGVVVSLAGISVLLRPMVPMPEPPTHDDLDVARTIADAQDHATAHLAQLGDKSLLFSSTRDAFVMYAVRGRTWIAMGGPIGPVEQRASLVWQLLEISELHGGRVAFYQVDEDDLALYADVGLASVKIGECARVDLTSFGLEGSRRKGLRSNHAKLSREGCSFSVVGPGEANLADLRAISDAWLAQKNTREKGFSLGFWSDRYIERCPIALVRVGARPVAFANLWATSTREELSIDLMRHLPETPKGTMDFLFTELMLWGRDNGYRWFDLGMAPLAGVSARRHAPAWNHFAAVMYRHGEHFYNFEGLRQYKNKFDPHWSARYLACQNGLDFPFVLADLTTLIAGGALGVIRR